MQYVTFTQPTVTIPERGTFTAVLGKIKSTWFGYEDHGIFTFNLLLDLNDGSAQGFGNVFLDGGPTDDRKGRLPSLNAHQAIMGVLRVVGVRSWEQVPGNSVFALYQGPGKWHHNSIAGIMAVDDHNRYFLLKDLKHD